MQSPSYRIVTICPQGMSSELIELFERPVASAPQMTVRDAIAADLTKSYRDWNVPFAGTVLAWARAGTIERDEFGEWLNNLSAVRIPNSDAPVSLELFVKEVDGGAMALGCFHPNQPEENLRLQPEARDDLFSRAYRNIVQRNMATDPVGVVIVVLAEEDEVAKQRLNSAVELLLPSEAPTKE
jgi:hypothetical protein